MWNVHAFKFDIFFFSLQTFNIFFFMNAFKKKIWFINIVQHNALLCMCTTFASNEESISLKKKKKEKKACAM